MRVFLHWQPSSTGLAVLPQLQAARQLVLAQVPEVWHRSGSEL